MSIGGSIKCIVKVVLWTIMGLLLLVLGLVAGIYSPWVQDKLSHAVVNYINSGNDNSMEISLGRVRLRFPLKLDVSGLAMVDKTSGDTLMSATGLYGSVKLLPLLKGDAGVENLHLIDAQYNMGSPDSAMYLRMRIGKLDVAPSDIKLGKKMEIDLSDATLTDGSLILDMNPLAPSSPSSPASPDGQPVIKAGRLELVNFSYVMSMPPTIDSLGATMRHAVLSDATIDLGAQTVYVDSIGARLQATYLTPPTDSTAAAVPATEVEADTTSTAAPWEIRLNKIRFSDSRALYAMKGYTPVEGFDPSYIGVDSIDLRVDNFLNRGTSLSIPISSLTAVERCGLPLQAKGTFSLDSVAMHLDDMRVASDKLTAIDLSAIMGMGDMAADPSLPLGITLKGDIDPEDMALMFPFAAPIMKAMGYGNPISLDVDASGTTGRLAINKLEAGINRCVDLSADGSVESPFVPDKLGGDININGRIINVTPLKNKLLDRALAKMFNIPPMRINGHVAMRSGNIDGNLRAVTRKGSIALKGSWKGRAEAYNATVATKDFPLDAFLPEIPLGDITADISAKGQGIDITSPKTTATAEAEIHSIVYDGHAYTGISAKADIADGKANVDLAGHNDDLDIDLNASGNLTGDTYAWEMNIEAPKIDMKGLNLSESVLDLDTDINAKAEYTPADSTLSVDMWIRDLAVRDSASVMDFSDIHARLDSSDSLTTVKITNRDLNGTFTSPTPLMTMIDRISGAADTLMAEVRQAHFSIEKLQRNLPPFEFTLNGGDDNFVTDALHPSGMSIRHIDMAASNDSLIDMNARVLTFLSKQQKIDTITFKAWQDSTLLKFNAAMNNRPGTFDNFAHVDVNGYLGDNSAMLRAVQKNIKGKTGFDIGMKAHFADSSLVVSLFPYDPVIAYKPWTINSDNFISYNIPHRHLDADLHLLTAQSSVELYTEHSTDHDHDHDGTEDHPDMTEQEDVILKVKNLRLADWLSINPFAPPVKGSAGADLRLSWTDHSLTGNGTVSVDSLYYGKERVGDFLAELDVTTDARGMIRAKADLSVDGVHTANVSGALNDSTATSPFNLDFTMIHFPLATVNPFLPQGTVRLRGTLNGKMDITGDSEQPIFNGALNFDSAAVKIMMLGADYPFSENPIQVKDNVVNLDNFSITGVNKKPLVINGTVDITNLSNAQIDLSAKARDMGLVNTTRAAKGADVFGKAFIDLDASVKGNMSYLDVDAELSVLAGTNATYTTVSASSAIESRETENLVRFVQFNDTTATIIDSIPEGSMAMAIDAVLNIESGSTFNVNLGSDGKVKLMTNGTLNYTQAPLAEGRLTGRLNITEGFVRYSVLVLGEKQFDFRDGSYVNFSGNMMNPSLNIQAYDRIRANVTQEGQNSRLVNFDVGLSITGTLNNINAAFNLSTDDDITIANELQSMTPEQRANQAMNMLLYNEYSGPGAKGNGNLGGNALYSFLENQLNSWAAQNIRGVDLSFGINQYDKTYDGSTSTTTQYSYKVSKSLFNDRVRIIVGGNYSTDADNDENFSQNLINDISFEYLLNRQGTMFIRIFRHTGYESILEGEVTQTGVGFVYKRKIRTFLDMFRPFRSYGVINQAPQQPADIPEESEKEIKSQATTKRDDENN